MCVTILKMHSAEGYLKALPTRAAQLATASIFYGTDGFVYSPPSASHSIDGDEMASVFSTAAVPAPSPAACSLRGKVKSAFKKATEKAKLSLGLISSRYRIDNNLHLFCQVISMH